MGVSIRGRTRPPTSTRTSSLGGRRLPRETRPRTRSRSAGRVGRASAPNFANRAADGRARTTEGRGHPPPETRARSKVARSGERPTCGDDSMPGSTCCRDAGERLGRPTDRIRDARAHPRGVSTRASGAREHPAGEATLPRRTRHGPSEAVTGPGVRSRAGGCAQGVLGSACPSPLAASPARAGSSSAPVSGLTSSGCRC